MTSRLFGSGAGENAVAFMWRKGKYTGFLHTASVSSFDFEKEGIDKWSIILFWNEDGMPGGITRPVQNTPMPVRAGGSVGNPPQPPDTGYGPRPYDGHPGYPPMDPHPSVPYQWVYPMNSPPPPFNGGAGLPMMMPAQQPFARPIPWVMPQNIPRMQLDTPEYPDVPMDGP